MIQRIVAIMRKEMLHIIRDPRTLILIFLIRRRFAGGAGAYDFTLRIEPVR